MEIGIFLVQSPRSKVVSTGARERRSTQAPGRREPDLTTKTRRHQVIPRRGEGRRVGTGRDTNGTESGRWVGTLCFNRKLTHQVVDLPPCLRPMGTVRTGHESGAEFGTQSVGTLSRGMRMRRKPGGFATPAGWWAGAR